MKIIPACNGKKLLASTGLGSFFLLDSNLNLLSSFKNSTEEALGTFSTHNEIYIEEMDILIIKWNIQNFLNMDTSYLLQFIPGPDFTNCNKKLYFESNMLEKLIYAKKNKILIGNKTNGEILNLINMMTYEKLEIKIGILNENSPNHSVYLIYEKDNKLILGLKDSSRVFEINLYTKEKNQLKNFNWIFKYSNIFDNENGIIYNLVEKNFSLERFNIKEKKRMKDLELNSLEVYQNQLEHKLYSWIKTWASMTNLKSEVNHYIDFVICVSYFNHLESLKGVLELFGYPKYSKEAIEKKDPYYRLFDKRNINWNIKSLLKEYLLKEGNLNLFSEEQKKRIGLNDVSL